MFRNANKLYKVCSRILWVTRPAGIPYTFISRATLASQERKAK